MAGMKLVISSTNAALGSLLASILITAPGFYVGLLGVTDMAPSSPRGFAGLAEISGYIFVSWSVLSAARLLFRRFLNNPRGRTGSLVAPVVLGYGFYLLTTVIGLDASLEHKEAFTRPLQPLGWMGLSFVALRGLTAGWRTLRERAAPHPSS